MSNMIIEDGKFVELTYEVVDKKTSEVFIYKVLVKSYHRR